MKQYLGAIEAGGTKFVCAVVDRDYKVARQVRIPTTTPSETLPAVLEFFREGASELAAIGVSTFGPVDLDPASLLFGYITLNSAVAGLKIAHLTKITSSFEFSVLTLTVPGLRLRKVQNTLCF